MSERIPPPSWTEWTRNPSDRSPQRKTFDDLAGELRKEGLIEVRSSLFVQLARYSYLQIKNARVVVQSFLLSIPDEIFRQISPAYRVTEIDAVLRILVAAGLATIEEETETTLISVILTERLGAGEVARGQEVHSVIAHLKEVFGKWDPDDLVSRPSSFPTVESVAKATNVDRAHLAPGEGCVAVLDKPDSNENNPNPFLQETIDQGNGTLALLQFWPLPDSKGSAVGPDPEFSLVISREMPLNFLVRNYCVPIFAEFFRSNDNHDTAMEIQAKYASYMHKYREKFPTALGAAANDRIDKVLATADPEGEIFANAVYVVAQMLRKVKSPVVYQAARIAYAHAMALRVRKRRMERAAAERTQDTALLVGRIRESTKPLTLDDLKKTTDGSRKNELGTKYPSVIELLPLTAPKEGDRPPIFEIRGAFVHRENLIKTFLDFRDREIWAQRERLARLWARKGIPAVEEVQIFDRDVSADFMRALELLVQERILAPNAPDFIREFVSEESNLYALAPALWPEGHRGAVTPLEVVLRGIDPILYEDKDRLRRRPLVGVLGLKVSYPQIVKAAWNIVLMEDGLLSFLLRKLASFFGGKPSAPIEEEEEAPPKKAASASSEGKGSGEIKSQKAVELKKLKEMAPILKDRAALIAEREKAAGQWCLKLDPEANRRTRQAVDDEIGRLMNKIVLDQLSEANGAKVALFLIDKSSVLESVTGSRAFYRYLYLTALQKRAESLGK